MTNLSGRIASDSLKLALFIWGGDGVARQQLCGDAREHEHAGRKLVRVSSSCEGLSMCEAAVKFD
jgi:hypothetical protein